MARLSDEDRAGAASVDTSRLGTELLQCTECSSFFGGDELDKFYGVLRTRTPTTAVARLEDGGAILGP